MCVIVHVAVLTDIIVTIYGWIETGEWCIKRAFKNTKASIFILEEAELSLKKYNKSCDNHVIIIYSLKTVDYTGN